MDGIRNEGGKIKRLEFRGEFVEPEVKPVKPADEKDNDETVGVGANEGEGDASGSDE